MQETGPADSKKRFLSDDDNRLGFEKKRKLQGFQNSSNQSTEAQLICVNNMESQPEETWVMMIDQLLSESIDDNFERIETAEIDSSSFVEQPEPPVAVPDHHQTVMLQQQESSDKDNDPLSGLSNEDFCDLYKMFLEDELYDITQNHLKLDEETWVMMIDQFLCEASDNFKRIETGEIDSCSFAEQPEAPVAVSYHQPVMLRLQEFSDNDPLSGLSNEDFCLLCKTFPEDELCEQPSGESFRTKSSGVDWETTECTEEMPSELFHYLLKEYRIFQSDGESVSDVPDHTVGETGESMNSAAELEMMEQVIGWFTSF